MTMMDDWPFELDGMLILSPQTQRVIGELRYRRATGYPMRRLIAWLQEDYGIEMTGPGIWRLLGSNIIGALPDADF